MKIALIGATGNIGTKILKELLHRGYHVTGISRHPEKMIQHKNLTPVKGDVHDSDAMVKILYGHDVVISSIHFMDFDGQTLLNTVKQSGACRYLVVGGAGSLEVAPGVQVLDTPSFPDEYRQEALLGREYLTLLQTEKVLDWVYLSPQLMLMPGERTGKFRIGTDQIIFNEKGQSTISEEDLAYAVVDELENQMFTQQRFTVGY